MWQGCIDVIPGEKRSGVMFAWNQLRGVVAGRDVFGVQCVVAGDAVECR